VQTEDLREQSQFFCYSSLRQLRVNVVFVLLLGSGPMEGPLQTLRIQKSSFQRPSIVDVKLIGAALWLTPTRQHVLFHTETMNMQDFLLFMGWRCS